jgi:hypothetical protein
MLPHGKCYIDGWDGEGSAATYKSMFTDTSFQREGHPGIQDLSLLSSTFNATLYTFSADI